MLRGLLLGIGIVLTVVCTMSFAGRETLTLAFVDFPPYEWQEDGEARGILVDVVKEACKKADVPVELRFLPFKRAFKEVREGRLSGLFNFYKTEQRLAHFDYSIPIIENRLVLFVRKDKEIDFKTLDDLQGYKIGVMRGYSYGEAFDAADLIREEANDHESAFAKLLYGRIDAYACDMVVGVYTSRKLGIEGELKVLCTPIETMKGHIGFTKGKYPEVIQKLNEQIEAMQQEGRIAEIVDGYLGASLRNSHVQKAH